MNFKKYFPHFCLTVKYKFEVRTLVLIIPYIIYGDSYGMEKETTELGTLVLTV